MTVFIPGLAVLRTRLAAMETRLAVNVLRDIVDEGFGGQLPMTAAFADEFIDETGINTGASAGYRYSNEAYDTVAETAFDSYPDSNRNNTSTMRAGSNEGVGQALNFASGVTVAGCSFSLAKVGSPTGNVVARLYNATGTVGTNAVPSGAAIATSGPVDVSTVPGAIAPVRFDFPAFEVLAAGDYCVMCEFTGGDVSNNIQIGIDTSPAHAGNRAQANTIGTWTANASMDIIYELYGGSASGNLRSNANVFPYNPNVIRVVARLEGEAPGGDFDVYVSRDGGTTFTLCPLALVDGFDVGSSIYSGEVDVSGQPAGANVVFEARSQNSAFSRVHGMWVQGRE